jgi:hypothetical protein
VPLTVGSAALLVAGVAVAGCSSTISRPSAPTSGALSAGRGTAPASSQSKRCAPNQYSVVTSDDGASGALVIGANVVYLHGPPCALTTVLTISLYSKRSARLLAVRGNPLSIPVRLVLGPGGPEPGGSYFWINWCDVPPPFYFVAHAGSQSAREDLPVQSPACWDSGQPSRFEPFSNRGP